MSDLEIVKNHLLSGGFIQVTNHLHSWIYNKKHIDLFGEDKDGFLTIKRSKHTESLKYCKIDFLKKA